MSGQKQLATKKYLRSVLCVMMCLMLFSTSFLQADETVYAQEEAVLPYNLETEGYDIVYVIDNSGSIWSQQEIRNQSFLNITNLAVGSDMRIGGVFFGDHVYDTLALTSMKDKDGSKKVMDFLMMTEEDKENIDTNIGAALETAIQLFDGQNQSREKIIVLFSDGINENEEKEADYTYRANKKTEEMAKILKEQNIPIYCVYLQKGRNDEAYLRNLVNYFSEEASYAEERFFKVEDNKISTLSQIFKDVFFAMQDDIKCSTVKLDSSGTANFYLPSLGIDQLRIYLDGDDLKGTVIWPKEQGTNSSFLYNTANFLLYEDPAPGDWRIEITEGEISAIYGTIAYHSQLSVKGELKQTEQSKEYQLELSFYDKAGEKVNLDENAVVTADIWVDKEEEESVKIPVEVTIADGMAKSEPFTMKEYGNYRYAVELFYNDTFTNEEMIHFQYEITGDTFEKLPITTYDKKGEEIYAKKTENGMEFAFKEEDLFLDADGEVINVTGFINVNKENPVRQVWQEDGYLYFVTEMAGDVEVKLQLTDVLGTISEVTIQGEVIDKEAEEKMNEMMAVVLVLLFLVFVINKMNTSKKKKKLQEKYKNLSEACDGLEKNVNVCRSELEKFHENKEKIEENLKPNGDLNNLLKEFEEDQLEMLDLKKYAAPDFMENIEKNLSTQEESDTIENAAKTITRAKEEAETIQNSKMKVQSALKKVSALLSEVETENAAVLHMTEQLNERNPEAENLLNSLVDKCEELEDILCEEIRYDLIVTNIPNLPIGMYQATDVAGDPRQGFYRLDEVTLLDGGTLGTELGETDIYVYGYQKESVTGLYLKSLRRFEYRNRENQNGFTVTKELLLCQGDIYELKVRIGQRICTMTMEAR